MNSSSRVEGYLNILDQLQQNSGKRQVEGLDKETVSKWLGSDIQLRTAIENAWNTFSNFTDSEKEILRLSEHEQISIIQSDYLNFYAPTTLNPYMVTE